MRHERLLEAVEATNTISELRDPAIARVPDAFDLDAELASVVCRVLPNSNDAANA